MRRLQIWGTLLCAALTLVLWVSAVFYYLGRQGAILSQWSALQQAIVRNAGLALHNWMELRLSEPGATAGKFQSEAFQNFSAGLPQMGQSSAWVFIDQSLSFSQGPDFGAENLGQAAAGLFAAQQSRGASHFDGLVNSVQAGGQGMDWFVWNPQVGRESASWTSLQVGGSTWTLGLATPETQVLAAFGTPADLQRELFGIGGFTVLLWSTYFVLWRPWRRKSAPSAGPLGGARQALYQAAANQALPEMDPDNRAREEFLANMSHELRTPLNTITGLAYALQCQVYGPVTEKQGHSLETILITSQHLSSLVDDVLDLSKLQAGRLKIDPRPVVLQALVATSLGLVDGQARAKQIQIQAEEIDAALVVEVDELRMRQVLVSLLGNAIKFTPAGGQVGIRCQPDAAGQCLSLTVWDTGIGISDEDMGRLFRPFVQLDSGTTRLQNGSGLGLALAARIIKLHDGCLALESQPGNGCQFTVRLPWYVEGENGRLGVSMDSLRIPEMGALGLSVQQVLVVDDDRRGAQILKEFLTAAGCAARVECGVDGALRACAEARPDVVVLSMPLANGDGLKAAPSLRSVPGCADVPIIALSAVRVPGDDRRALDAGVCETIFRPVKMEILAQAILRHSR